MRAYLHFGSGGVSLRSPSQLETLSARHRIFNRSPLFRFEIGIASEVPLSISFLGTLSLVEASLRH